MYRLVVCTLFFLLAVYADAQPKLRWHESVLPDGENFGMTIAFDRSSSMYVGGYFSDTVYFASDTLIAQDHPNAKEAYIVKYDSLKNHLWARQIGMRSGFAYLMDIVPDKDGDIYVSGEFTDTCMFGPFQLVARTSTDGFVAKLDSNGNFLWAFQIAGRSFDFVPDIEVDDSSNVYVTGSFAIDVYFGNIFLDLHLGTDVLIGKIDKNGNALWVKWAGSFGNTGNNHDDGFGIALDNDNNSYVTGRIRDTAYFDNDTLFTEGQSDIFIAKYSPDGNLIWAKRAGYSFQIYEETGFQIIQYNDTQMAMSGLAYNGAEFDSLILELPPNTYQSAFVAILDTSGSFVRLNNIADAELYGGYLYGAGKCLLTDHQGNLFMPVRSQEYAIGSYLLQYMTIGLVMMTNQLELLWFKKINDIRGLAMGYDGIYFTGSEHLQTVAARLGEACNSAEGILFKDLNSDSLYNLSEPVLINDTLMLLPDSIWLQTDSTGHFIAYLDTGEYIIERYSQLTLNQSIPFNPDFYQYNFTNCNQNFIDQNFGYVFTDGILSNKISEYFQIYFDQSSKILHIEVDNPDALPYSFQIYSLDGKLCLKKENLSTTKFSIELDELRPAPYFVSIFFSKDSGNTNRKIVITD